MKVDHFSELRLIFASQFVDSFSICLSVYLWGVLNLPALLED
jgi:hypothetical protein